MLRLATLFALTAVLSVSSAPVNHVARQTVPQANLVDATKQIENIYAAAIGRESNDPTNPDQNQDVIGNMVQQWIPIASDLNGLIGYNNVIAIDVLADRACIAGAGELYTSGRMSRPQLTIHRLLGQGSVCDEVLAYAYALYVAQQNSYTYKTFAKLVGVSQSFSPHLSVY